MTAREVLWTADEAARVTAGEARRDWQATGVSIDSRTVAPGDLFVAIRGPKYDGHDFVGQALAAGAAAAMPRGPSIWTCSISMASSNRRSLGPTCPIHACTNVPS